MTTRDEGKSNSVEWQQLLEKMRDGMFDADLLSGRVSLSRRFVQLLGYEKADARRLGEIIALRALIHPDDQERVGDDFARAMSGGESCSTMRLLMGDGGYRWFEVRAVLQRDAAGLLVRVMGFLRDVTSTREMQEQLLQSQKMEAIGQLARGIAHDFNNLLTAIDGYRSLIAENLPASHEVQEDLAGMAQAVESAAGLVRQLLAFSRKQPVHPVVLDPADVIDGMLTLVRRAVGASIDVQVRSDAPLRKVLIDRGQLEQVVLNLALNARDAMPSGGTLTFLLRNVSKGATSATSSLDQVEIVVRDTGVGMDAAMLSHIFEPSFTTKDPERGTGLGLPTSLGIVERAGGSIDVSSRPGAGSSFRICLPAVPDDTASRVS